MNQSTFIQSLTSIKNSYKWSYQNGQIVGVAKHGAERGLRFDPIRALVRTTRAGSYQTTSQAAKAIELPDTVVKSLTSTDNRGNSQVLRGRVRQVLQIT
jgi:hypothetical protein